jgi:phage protein|nr:MAG TPA: Protein of unknown function (DUF2634) [Caudoviricetes sp.]
MDFETLFLKQDGKKEKKELPLFKEYAINFDTLEPLKNGDRLVELNGNEALKVWIFKVLKTKRNFYGIHSDSYGNDLDEHIGTIYQESVKNALIISEIKDCLLVNPYILDCYNFELKYNSDDNHLKVSFNVSTIYGESEVNYVE